MFYPQIIQNRSGQKYKIWTSHSSPNGAGSDIKKFNDRSETVKFLSELIVPTQFWGQLGQFISRPQLGNASPLDVNRALSELLLSNRIRFFEINPGESIKQHVRSTLPDSIQELPAKAGCSTSLGPHSHGKSTLQTTWFKWSLVDEIGKGIDGVDFKVVVDGEHHNLTTDKAGKVEISDATDKFVFASFADIEQLYDQVEPRWEEPREGGMPTGAPQKVMQLRGQMDKISLADKVEHQLVITPALGLIYVELWDTFGQVRHANCDYSIEGMATYSGKTDAQGRLRHEQVRPGQYTLSLTLIFFKNTDYTQTDQYSVPLVVLPQTASEPQIRFIGSVPSVYLSRVKGELFDTNKSFLLPGALESINQIRETYLSLPLSDILITGHTDTTADASVNDPLSEERAKITKAFFEDDVGAWLDMYSTGVPSSRRWQEKEDRLMIQALPDFSPQGASGDFISWFQRSRNLKVDGESGTETRTQLIKEYMALDGGLLSEVQGFELEISTLGCGEDFPLDDTGEQLDGSPEDEKEDAKDRRVEFFFFNREFGILPPPEKGNKENYKNWIAQSVQEKTYNILPVTNHLHYLDISDAFFRKNSSMMIPANDTLSGDSDISPLKAMIEIFGFVKKYPNSRLLFAGHTDSVGSKADNQKLSEQRAQFVYSLIAGDRDVFKKLANDIDRVEDWKQVLKWLSITLQTVPVLAGAEAKTEEKASDSPLVHLAVTPEGFDACDPGIIDNIASTGESALKQFQQAFNRNKSSMGVASEDIKVDGTMGEESWGAIFDCYQYVFARESNLSLKGLEDLRGRLQYLPTQKPYIGFGELFPRSGEYKDNVKCETDRRVEVLLFQPGQEPDIDLLNSNPEATELYTSKKYQRQLLTFGKIVQEPHTTKVRNTQLFGMIFDANKCFLLPQALPGIRDVVRMHKQNEKSKVLIVGHDGGDEDFKGVDIARCRAQIVGQYLKSDFESWTKWFSTSKPVHVRWGVREVQLMLSALPETGTPYYIGAASGVYDTKTIKAVKTFQGETGLTVDGKAGPLTQAELIKAYMNLEDTTLTQDIEPVAHGCEGKFEDEGLAEKGIFPDSRVLEVMFFEDRIVPRPKKSTSTDGDQEYFEWKKQVVETQFFQHHGLHIQMIDRQKKPIRFGKVIIEGPTHRYGFTDEQGFVFFADLQAGDYQVSAVKEGKRITSSRLTYPTAKVKYRAS